MEKCPMLQQLHCWSVSIPREAMLQHTLTYQKLFKTKMHEQTYYHINDFINDACRGFSMKRSVSVELWFVTGGRRSREPGARGGTASTTRHERPHWLLQSRAHVFCIVSHRVPTLAHTSRHSQTIRQVTSTILIQTTLQGGGEEEEENQPLDLSWPDTCRERITYLAFLPIIIPLWLTLPDTRKESGQREHVSDSCARAARVTRICDFVVTL